MVFKNEGDKALSRTIQWYIDKDPIERIESSHVWESEYDLYGRVILFRIYSSLLTYPHCYNDDQLDFVCMYYCSKTVFV